MQEENINKLLKAADVSGARKSAALLRNDASVGDGCYCRLQTVVIRCFSPCAVDAYWPGLFAKLLQKVFAMALEPSTCSVWLGSSFVTHMAAALHVCLAAC